MKAVGFLLIIEALLSLLCCPFVRHLDALYLVGRTRSEGMWARQDTAAAAAAPA